MLVKQLMANSWLLTWSGKKSQGYSNLFFSVISEKEDLRVKGFKNYFLSQKRKNKEKEKKKKGANHFCLDVLEKVAQ